MQKSSKLCKQPKPSEEHECPPNCSCPKNNYQPSEEKKISFCEAECDCSNCHTGDLDARIEDCDYCQKKLWQKLSPSKPKTCNREGCDKKTQSNGINIDGKQKFRSLCKKHRGTEPEEKCESSFHKHNEGGDCPSCGDSPSKPDRERIDEVEIEIIEEHMFDNLRKVNLCQIGRVLNQQRYVIKQLFKAHNNTIK